MITYVHDDGGRAEAGFRGEAGDCAVRAAAIVTGLPYQQVYDEINRLGKLENRRKKKPSNSRTGVWPDTMTSFLRPLGYEWVPTMQIGSGCQVHLHADELPSGKLVVRVSKHYAAVIDGVLHDNHDCSREGTRCVYGFWMKVR